MHLIEAYNTSESNIRQYKKVHSDDVLSKYNAYNFEVEAFRG